MWWRSRCAFAVPIVVALAFVTLRVAAQSAPSPSTPPSAVPSAPPTPEAIARAKGHFERGKELYRAGAYREAITEVELARALDPQAKQLAFNLAVLHEKVGEIDAALRDLREFLRLDIDAGEREKALSTIRRLEGSRRDASPPSSASARAPAPGGGPPGEPPGEPPPSSGSAWGRFDAATFFAATTAVTAAGVGTYFGLRAAADRPTNFVTGVNGSFADFTQRNAVAHREAIVADVAFAVGIVAGAAAAVLFFGRSPTVASRPGVSGLSMGPLRDGGACVVEGRF